MDHYYKGENQEESLTRESVPISGLPERFSWEEVTGSTRVRSVVGLLCKRLREERALVLSGSGPHTSKVVTLAEIIKRKQKHVVTTVQTGERVVKEFWEPKEDLDGLDTLVVTRRLPTLHILLNICRDEDQGQTRQRLQEALWGKSDNRRQRRRKNKTGPEHKEME